MNTVNVYTMIPKLLNMTLTASVVICAVLVLRLLLRRAPKIFSYVLWLPVLIRLFCPFSFRSPLSLLTLLRVPSAKTGAFVSTMEYIPVDIVHTEFPEVTLPMPGVSTIINDNLPKGMAQTAGDPMEFPMSLSSMLWLLGIAVMLVYGICTSIVLWRKLRIRVHLRDNIFLADDIRTPFVCGLLRPKIFLPAGLDAQEQEYILLHEQHHIRRGDHIVKLLAFLALTIHWFNPLVWLAFSLASADMEMSCDEAVIKERGGDIRAAYSASLLSFAAGRRIAGFPLAFSEGSTKGRIRNLSAWKKPVLPVILLSAAVTVVSIAALLANPLSASVLPRYLNVLLSPDYQAGGVWEYRNEDASVVSVLELKENLAFEGTVTRNGETSALCVQYRFTKGNARRGVAKLYACSSALAQTAEGEPYFLFEASMRAVNGKVRFLFDEDGEAFFKRKSVDYVLKTGENQSVSVCDRWFDTLDGDRLDPYGVEAIRINDYPGAEFRIYDNETLSMVTSDGKTDLFGGWPIWSVYFCDLNGDGKREVCSAVSFGSGIIDERIYAADIENQVIHELSDRTNYDYTLSERNGRLWVKKLSYADHSLIEEGYLTMETVIAGDGSTPVTVLSISKAE